VAGARILVRWRRTRCREELLGLARRQRPDCNDGLTLRNPDPRRLRKRYRCRSVRAHRRRLESPAPRGTRGPQFARTAGRLATSCCGRAAQPVKLTPSTLSSEDKLPSLVMVCLLQVVRERRVLSTAMILDCNAWTLILAAGDGTRLRPISATSFRARVLPSACAGSNSSLGSRAEGS
jgi:hypothetical protein